MTFAAAAAALLHLIRVRVGFTRVCGGGDGSAQDGCEFRMTNGETKPSQITLAATNTVKLHRGNWGNVLSLGDFATALLK